MRKIICVILSLIFVGTAVFAGWKLYQQQAEYQSGEDAYTELEQYVHIPDPPPAEELPAQEESEAGVLEKTEPSDGPDWPDVDFEALQAVNPDVIAWIYIEGTVINYPVVKH